MHMTSKNTVVVRQVKAIARQSVASQNRCYHNFGEGTSTCGRAPTHPSSSWEDRHTRHHPDPSAQKQTLCHYTDQATPICENFRRRVNGTLRVCFFIGQWIQFDAFARLAGGGYDWSSICRNMIFTRWAWFEHTTILRTLVILRKVPRRWTDWPLSAAELIVDVYRVVY